MTKEIKASSPICELTISKSQQSAPKSDSLALQIIDYSERSFAIVGDTKPIKEQLKELGGRFNGRLTCGAGWVFPKTKLESVKSTLTNI